MKIALVGATGNVGTRILDELVRRGHRVTAIARHPEKLAGRDGVTTKAVDADVVTELSDALKGHEAVVSSLRFHGTDPQKLIKAVKASGVKRYLVVGGAGSLHVAPDVLLIDTPEFPDAYKAEARAGTDFLDMLRGEKDLDWTFLSPSALFVAGERTGEFRLGKDDLLVGTGGSSISYEDYAVALVDEIEKPAHSRQRFTVGY